MLIYKITNLITNKSYIGKTSKSLGERWKKHQYNASKKINRRLYDSMNKHGYENFYIEVLEEHLNDSLLSEREKYFIKYYNTLLPNGYNMTIGGDGGYTLKDWSEEDRNNLYEQQANNRIGWKPTDKTIKNMSVAAIQREKNKTDSRKKEISEKISNTLKEKYKSGELQSFPPNLFGKDHPGYIEVDTDFVIKLIKDGLTIGQISEKLSVSKHAIRNRLIEKTGKNFREWSKEKYLN